MCERYAPLLSRRTRRRLLTWSTAVTLLGAAACSDDSAPAVSTSNDVEAVDTSEVAEDAPDVVTPVKTSGDPIAAGAPQTLDTGLATGSLAGGSGRVLTTDGDRLVALSDGPPLTIHTLDAAAVAVASSGNVDFAVDSAGTWYRFEGDDVVRVTGPIVQRLRTDGDVLVGVLGRGGLVSAPATLATAPTAVTAVPVARDLAFGPGYWVVARETSGFSVVTPDGKVRSTFATQRPATAVAALSDGRFLAVESGTAVHVLEVTTAGDAASIDVLGSADYLGLGLAIAPGASGQHALVSDWRSVTAIDLRDPAAPVVIGAEPTPWRALDLIADGGDAYMVRGLDRAARLTVAIDDIAPQVSLSPELIQIEAAAEFNGGSSGLLVRNDGQEPLEVRRITVGDDRVALSLPPKPDGSEADFIVPPGDVEFLELAVTTVTPFETTLTFETNDKSRPTVTVPIAINPTRLAVGDPAPSFTLPTTGGALVTLADHRGEVVFVKLFNRY